VPSGSIKAWALATKSNLRSADVPWGRSALGDLRRVSGTEREEKASVVIASNESFGGWTKAFTDPRLCAAIVDRLTFGGTILETGTDSYRLAQATKQLTQLTS
jgi:IstB-like ATP binding protein